MQAINVYCGTDITTRNKDASHSPNCSSPSTTRLSHSRVGMGARQTFLSPYTSATSGGGDRVPVRSPPISRELRRSPREGLLDSGANGHIMVGANGLVNLRRIDRTLHAANDKLTKLHTAGDLTLRVTDEAGNELEPIVLRDASVHKASPINLVSISMLCEEGAKFHFAKGDSYFIYRGQRFNVEERDGLYIIRLDQILQGKDFSSLKDAQAASGCTSDVFRCDGKLYGCGASFQLWHERLGHSDVNRIKFLYDNGAAEGLEVSGRKHKHDKSCKCPTCLTVNNSKRHIGDVRKFADSITQVAQLLYADLMGPFPMSVDGYTYVINFTDSYSRFSCCYFLKTKDEAPSALRSVIDYYKREGFVIKKLRTDQGGEFLGGRERDEAQLKRDASLDKAFAKICGEHGIVHELTPAYRPEIHGLAERWNKTVMKMANSMLFAARLSHILWPAAVAHANAIRNRLPVRGLGRYTPYELFYKQRPRLGDFKVFGCDAYKLLPTYPKVPGQMARKRLIFVGFTPDRLGYRCFDPIEFRFTTEFELVFDEQSAKKRINSLREYDIRRELQRRGRLSDLPLEGNDFDPNDTSGAAAQDSERRIFHQPSLRPDSGTGGEEKSDGLGPGFNSDLRATQPNLLARVTGPFTQRLEHNDDRDTDETGSTNRADERVMGRENSASPDRPTPDDPGAGVDEPMSQPNDESTTLPTVDGHRALGPSIRSGRPPALLGFLVMFALAFV